MLQPHDFTGLARPGDDICGESLQLICWGHGYTVWQDLTIHDLGEFEVG